MALAVDTNVLARSLIDDGSDQCRRARAILSEEDVFVGDTVLLETEWLLRSVMDVPRAALHAMFSILVSTENVFFADRSRVADCIIAYEAGLDFADAMHLYGASSSDAFATFDNDLRRKVRRLKDAIPVVAA